MEERDRGRDQEEMVAGRQSLQAGVQVGRVLVVSQCVQEAVGAGPKACCLRWGGWGGGGWGKADRIKRDRWSAPSAPTASSRSRPPPPPSWPRPGERGEAAAAWRQAVSERKGRGRKAKVKGSGSAGRQAMAVPVWQAQCEVSERRAGAGMCVERFSSPCLPASSMSVTVFLSTSLPPCLLILFSAFFPLPLLLSSLRS